jgi:hypothetical protein
VLKVGTLPNQATKAIHCMMETEVALNVIPSFAVRSTNYVNCSR